MPTIEEIIKEFDWANHRWTTADWCHELVSNNGTQPADGKVVYCQGDNPLCATCVKAAEDAQEALGYAEQALDALQLGDTQQAAYLARRAASIEFEWGDHPTWGAFCRMVEEMDEQD